MTVPVNVSACFTRRGGKPVTRGDGPLLGPGSAHRSQPERGDLLSFDAADTASPNRVKDEYLTTVAALARDDRNREDQGKQASLNARQLAPVFQ